MRGKALVIFVHCPRRKNGFLSVIDYDRYRDVACYVCDGLVADNAAANDATR